MITINNGQEYLQWIWPWTYLALSDGQITNGSATFTSATGNFITNVVVPGQHLKLPRLTISQGTEGVTTNISNIFTSASSTFLTDGITGGGLYELVVPDQIVASGSDGSVTSGSDLFTAAGATFITDSVGVGMTLKVDGFPASKVTAVISETQLQLVKSFNGTDSNRPYEVRTPEFKADVTSVDSETQLTMDSSFNLTDSNLQYEILIPKPKLLSEAIGTITFDANGTLPNGEHLNQFSTLIDEGTKCFAPGPIAPITVANGADPGPPPAPNGIGSTVDAIVTPTQIDAFSTEPVTYTVTIQNTGTVTLEMEEIHVMLPPNFSYVPLSYTGLLLDDPDEISDAGNYRDDLLFEDFTNDELDPGEINTFSFQAEAKVIEGVYQALVWVIVTEKELGCFSSGPTAELDVLGEYDAQVTTGNLTTQIHVKRSAVDGSIIIESWQNK